MKYSQKKGYTLLFAVIVSVLLLSIGAFILSVSRKEAILASSSRDSIYAFYAADSGLECAVENLANLSTSTSNGSISCGSNSTGSNISSFTKTSATDTHGVYGTTTFYVLTGSSASASSKYQSGVSSCAMVQVGQEYDNSGNLNTVIISRGNNIGWNPTGNGINIGYGVSTSNGNTGDCSITGPRKVERALQYFKSS